MATDPMVVNGKVVPGTPLARLAKAVGDQSAGRLEVASGDYADVVNYLGGVGGAGVIAGVTPGHPYHTAVADLRALIDQALAGPPMMAARPAAVTVDQIDPLDPGGDSASGAVRVGSELDGLGTAENEPADGLEDLTVAELKGLAADRGVDLGGATKKAEIVEAIRKGR